MQNIKTQQQDGSGPHRQGNSRTDAKRETVKRPPVYAAQQPSKNEFK
ncbi:hypothetical protein [Aeromonas allosaccharophila]|nr:hypothetical protein [Aeromonas allosaccharophila]